MSLRICCTLSGEEMHTNNCSPMILKYHGFSFAQIVPPYNCQHKRNEMSPQKHKQICYLDNNTTRESTKIKQLGFGQCTHSRSLLCAFKTKKLCPNKGSSPGAPLQAKKKKKWNQNTPRNQNSQSTQNKTKYFQCINSICLSATQQEQETTYSFNRTLLWIEWRARGRIQYNTPLFYFLF